MASRGASARTDPRRRVRPARRLAGGGGRPGRVALVTGAGRGIGAATVRALAARGRPVVAVDREDDDPRLRYALGRAADAPGAGGDAPPPGDAPRTRGAPPTAGGSVVAHAADVTDADALAAAVAFAEERFGGLD